METVVFRRGQQQDASRILERTLQADASIDASAASCGIVAALEDDGKGRYYLGELDGHTVVILFVFWEWSDWRNGKAWWLSQAMFTEDTTLLHDAAFKFIEGEAKRQNAKGLRFQEGVIPSSFLQHCEAGGATTFYDVYVEELIHLSN